MIETGAAEHSDRAPRESYHFRRPPRDADGRAGRGQRAGMYAKNGGGRGLSWWLSAACAVLVATDLVSLALGLASLPRFVQRAGTQPAMRFSL